MNKNQQAQALLTLFISLYEERFGFKPSLNRYRLKWGAVDMINSVGYPTARDIIEYYIGTEADHSFEHLLNNFDRINEMRVQREADNVRREKIRKETQRRVEEFERRSSSN